MKIRARGRRRKEVILCDRGNEKFLIRSYYKKGILAFFLSLRGLFPPWPFTSI